MTLPAHADGARRLPRNSPHLPGDVMSAVTATCRCGRRSAPAPQRVVRDVGIILPTIWRSDVVNGGGRRGRLAAFCREFSA
jgi:hypothetical protein